MKIPKIVHCAVWGCELFELEQTKFEMIVHHWFNDTHRYTYRVVSIMEFMGPNLQQQQKTSPKGFSASKCNVGNGILSKSQEYFRKLFGNFLDFFGNFLNFNEFFWKFLGNFSKGFFWRNFLAKFFGRIFGRIVFGVILLE